MKASRERERERRYVAHRDVVGAAQKDYEAQQAADSLASQAEAPASEPIAEASFDPGSTDAADDAEELAEAATAGVAA
jgi:hypothetical protein